MIRKLFIKKIVEINEFIRSKPWLDFELIEIVNRNLKIHASTDFSYFHELEIIFKEVFYVQCPDNWKTDTSKDVLVLPEVEEQKVLNLTYEIEQGYNLIKIIAEDIGPIYISCESIEYSKEKVTYKV